MTYPLDRKPGARSTRVAAKPARLSQYASVGPAIPAPHTSTVLVCTDLFDRYDCVIPSRYRVQGLAACGRLAFGGLFAWDRLHDDHPLLASRRKKPCSEPTGVGRCRLCVAGPRWHAWRVTRRVGSSDTFHSASGSRSESAKRIEAECRRDRGYKARKQRVVGILRRGRTAAEIAWTAQVDSRQTQGASRICRERGSGLQKRPRYPASGAITRPRTRVVAPPAALTIPRRRPKLRIASGDIEHQDAVTLTPLAPLMSRSWITASTILPVMVSLSPSHNKVPTMRAKPGRAKS
jgi:hypothetical protein